MGVNKIKAVADDYIDEIEINRVAEPDESYALKVEESGNSGSNWFETIEVTATELQFPEGYFSIHDKFGDIMKNPEGEELITGLMDMISTQMNMKISKGMLNMAKGMTIEKIFSLAGDRVPEKAKLWLNEELNKIKK